jgi:hypothetical protein
MFRNGLGWVDFEWVDANKEFVHIIEQRMAKDGTSASHLPHFLNHGLLDVVANGTKERAAPGESQRCTYACQCLVHPQGQGARSDAG